MPLGQPRRGPGPFRMTDPGVVEAVNAAVGRGNVCIGSRGELWLQSASCRQADPPLGDLHTPRPGSLACIPQ